MSISNSKPIQFKTFFCKFFKEILFAIIAFAHIFLLLILTEIVLVRYNNFGYNGPNTFPKTGKERIYTNYGMPWLKNEFQQIVIENRNGFHSIDFGKKEGRDFRIAILGNSFLDARHLPKYHNFALQTNAMIPELDIIPLGFNGYSLPLYKVLCQTAINEIFGEDAEYPSIDALIFAVTDSDIKFIAKGDKNLDVSLPKQSWQTKTLKPILVPAIEYLNTKDHTHRNVVSLFRHKIHAILEQNYFQTFTIDEKRLKWAKRVYKRDVLIPLIHFSNHSKIPIGILYIPRIYEFNETIEAKHNPREYMLSSYEEMKIPFVNALEFFPSNKGTYFPHDTHPTALGNYYISLGLKELISKHFYPSLKQ